MLGSKRQFGPAGVSMAPVFLYADIKVLRCFKAPDLIGLLVSLIRYRRTTGEIAKYLTIAAVCRKTTRRPERGSRTS